MSNLLAQLFPSITFFPREKGHNLDNMSYIKGAFNNSSTGIVETAFLVEPPGWYPGRPYYVVWRGYTVGLFHEMVEVHRSTDAFTSAMWHVCTTWEDAVRVWGIVCRAGAVEILRKWHGSTAASSAAVEIKPINK
ncbi:hypothetical protein HYPSUDRAFT_207549 [Hypholoma sublateritium FD-334 SS-4]|uniref:Uncharacterized protein n=1 Tax=Hypholoma sublateritium (strain FD-334 SS-4) TaxID=945553 RepID=A0A0D2LY56_HYPSF|nr:hypothetical protein HYPSUDRAFT_207549 [Hypholoma sublateritium FD-334 SS-4]